MGFRFLVLSFRVNFLVVIRALVLYDSFLFLFSRKYRATISSVHIWTPSALGGGHESAVTAGGHWLRREHTLVVALYCTENFDDRLWAVCELKFDTKQF